MPSSRGIFQTQELNPGLPHCRQIPYHLNHQGSPVWPQSPSFQSQVFGDHELSFGEMVTWTSLGWHGCHCSKPSLQAGLLRLGEGARSVTLLSFSLPLALVFWSVLTPLFVWPPIRAESLMFLGCGSFPPLLSVNCAGRRGRFQLTIPPW